MNIQFDNEDSKLQNLNESSKQVESNISLEKLVLKTPAKQFKFECGVVMARINVPLDTRFGLYWHAKNSENLESFFSSIESFINNPLTEIDKKLLTKQYSKK